MASRRTALPFHIWTHTKAPVLGEMIRLDLSHEIGRKCQYQLHNIMEGVVSLTSDSLAGTLRTQRRNPKT